MHGARPCIVIVRFKCTCLVPLVSLEHGSLLPNPNLTPWSCQHGAKGIVIRLQVQRILFSPWGSPTTIGYQSLLQLSEVPAQLRLPSISCNAVQCLLGTVMERRVMCNPPGTPVVGGAACLVPPL